MHSSKMRTPFSGDLGGGGLPRGVSAWGCLSKGVSTQGVSIQTPPRTQRQTPPDPEADTPWTHRQTPPHPEADTPWTHRQTPPHPEADTLPPKPELQNHRQV